MAAPFNKIVGPVPVATVVGVGAVAQLLIPPVLAQLMALIQGAFGLGLLKADLLARLNAALQFNVSITNPLLQLQMTVTALLALLAELQAQLAIGVPKVQLTASAQLTLIAEIQAKLGGINLLIDAALGVRIPVLDFLAQLEAAFSLGNVVLYAWSAQTMPQALAQMNSYDFPGDSFGPATPTYGVLFVTATPGAGGSFKFLFNPALPA